jgi:hypothetical protein
LFLFVMLKLSKNLCFFYFKISFGSWNEVNTIEIDRTFFSVVKRGNLPHGSFKLSEGKKKKITFICFPRGGMELEASLGVIKALLSTWSLKVGK